jgi:hypothetical protein
MSKLKRDWRGVGACACYRSPADPPVLHCRPLLIASTGWWRRLERRWSGRRRMVTLRACRASIPCIHAPASAPAAAPATTPRWPPWRRLPLSRPPCHSPQPCRHPCAHAPAAASATLPAAFLAPAELRQPPSRCSPALPPCRWPSLRRPSSASRPRAARPLCLRAEPPPREVLLLCPRAASRQPPADARPLASPAARRPCRNPHGAADDEWVGDIFRVQGTLLSHRRDWPRPHQSDASRQMQVGCPVDASGKGTVH